MRPSFAAAVAAVCLLATCIDVLAQQDSQPEASSAAQANAQEDNQQPPGPWPRQVPLSDGLALVYQPQVQQWQVDDIKFRAAVSVTLNGTSDPVFGVIWATAQTEVDQVSRTVILDGVQLLRANFPSMADGGASVLAGMRQFYAANPPDAVPLDFIQASLGASRTTRPQGVPVQNTPPRIIVSYSPALLVPIHGDAVLKPVAGTDLSRVINTRFLILRDGAKPPYYLHVYDGWMRAPAMDGPWEVAKKPPASLDATAEKLSKAGIVDLLDGGPNAKHKASLAAGAPTIHVAHAAAELVVFVGKPDFTPITGTGLLWAGNTASDVIVVVDTTSNLYYVVISGRWYRAATLDGPWDYVANNALPASFARIPPNTPAGVVLSTVAGTPQAQEAVIATTIPQTARVPLTNGPAFTPAFDGDPQYRPIDGTPLSYVVNSDLPLIRVAPDSFYAVQTGVWFAASNVTGPWSVATSVPEVIYTIPSSSPLFYVTYAKIYEATADYVDVGYTPGYTGSVVTTDETVVYGTGYWYQPWIGDDFYPVALTYGIDAVPIYNQYVGYAYAFGYPAALDPYWYWGTPYYAPAYWGTTCCGTVTEATNVYRAYGNTVASGTRSWYEDSNGKVGTTAQGSYTNERTGTTGNYSGGRSYNPNNGNLDTSTDRTFNRANGATGSVDRSGQYDTETGARSYDSNMSATTAGGSTVNRTASASMGSDGLQRDASTTVNDARTGQSYTRDTGSSGGGYYAGDDGNVYRNNGNGWEQNRSDGSWQAAGDRGGLNDGGWGGGRSFGGGGFGGGFRGGRR